MKGWNKKYLIRFVVAMGVYVLLLPASLFLIESDFIESTAVKWAVVLLPVIPFLFAITAVLHNVRAADELDQKIHLDSILITTLVTGGLTFSYGLLESSELLPHLPTIIIAPAMIGIWGISTAIITRRYR